MLFSNILHRICLRKLRNTHNTNMGLRKIKVSSGVQTEWTSAKQAECQRNVYGFGEVDQVLDFDDSYLDGPAYIRPLYVLYIKSVFILTNEPL